METDPQDARARPVRVTGTPIAARGGLLTFGLAVLLAGCATLPTAVTRVPAPLAQQPGLVQPGLVQPVQAPPVLVPLDGILAQADAVGTGADAVPSVAPRADRLRARADRLRRP